jgi:cellulose biosynthesis protein BcsQ
MLAVISLKGGVGKTSVSLGLAATAWAAGHRTLVVDLDPQANATAGLDPHPYEFTTNDVLADGRTGIAAEAIVPSGWGPGIDLIAGERALEHRAHAEGPDSVLRLRNSLAGALDRYHTVILDCPPSLGELTRNALAAAPAALIVTEPSYFALQGAEQALESVEIARAATNLGLRPAGIVVNRVRRSSEHSFRLEELRRAYPSLVLDPPLPDRTAMAAAQGAAVPLTALHTSGAKDLMRLFATLSASIEEALA